MTIWFSTNIPEMRAISTFNRVSTDIGNIQQRITTGQRINSGKDDPGGLIIREGLRVDIKNVQASQQEMVQAQNVTNTAGQGMMQLLEILRGDNSDPTNNGIVGMLATEDITTAGAAKVLAAITDAIALYDSAVGATQYNGEFLIGSTGITKTYRLGTDTTAAPLTLTVDLPKLASNEVGNGSDTLKGLEALTFDSSADWTKARSVVKGVIDTVTSELGTLGYKQQVIAQNQNVLQSRLTSVTEAEGLISNADIAVESSRLARSELLAQNSMNSIMYNRQYAAFAVSSLFG